MSISKIILNTIIERRGIYANRLLSPVNITKSCGVKGLKLKQLPKDVVEIANLKKPSAEKLNMLLKEQGISAKYVCDNNSLFLEELINRFPITAGEKTNSKLQDIMLYLKDIDHSKYLDKRSFLNEFLNNVNKVEKMTDIEGKTLYAKSVYSKQAIIQAKYNQPEVYKDIMDLYKLHKEGKAPRYVLQTLFSKSTFHPLPKSDMQKLLKGENYYPQLNSLSNDLISPLKTGEAFSVGNDMFVKTEKGYEKLKINAKIYEKLFPPIERYTLAQGPLGNCHLIATLDSILKNPEGRIELYKMFETVNDGRGVKCTIAGYKDKGIIYNFDDLTKLYGKYNVKGSLGSKMIENTYAQNEYNQILQSVNKGNFYAKSFLETRKIPIEVFDRAGDYDDVQEHITNLIGKKAEAILDSNYKKLQGSAGINIVNNTTGFKDEPAGIISGHFYNTNLVSNTVINPWNTILEIHQNPFELSEIVHVI